ncbi:MAG TPA: hypothetical protein VIV11_25675 [Kofleriaceae bacterium]
MHTQREVLFLDTRHSPLPRAMREQYLLDLQGWVIAMCRLAVATHGDRVTLDLIQALYGAGGVAGDFTRWQSIGPHASIRREFQLSDDAVSILLLASAPRLWGALSHVYASITPSCLFRLDQKLLELLLDDRAAVARELHRGAPLIRTKLVSVRSTGSIVPNGAVVRRLIGS